MARSPIKESLPVNPPETNEKTNTENAAAEVIHSPGTAKISSKKIQ